MKELKRNTSGVHTRLDSLFTELLQSLFGPPKKKEEGCRSLNKRDMTDVSICLSLSPSLA